MTDHNEVGCFVGLGSNLNNPIEQLHSAIQALERLTRSRLKKVSSFYAGKPMGPQDQPDYVNAVAELTTSLSAHQLLDQLQQIELNQGRERKGERWGARTLDLDLLVYGQEQINEARLVVPHYGIAQRNFVLYPLSELVDPEFQIPGLGKLSELVIQCNRADLVKI